MRLVRTIAELREVLAKERQAGSIGLVPTMGYLHQGHLSLVEASRARDRYTVMSIFVNPIQFGPNEDFARYPRDLERDCAMAEAAGVDLLFYPGADEMYPTGYCTYVTVEGLSERLCGRFRPGHFRGVTTVVSKLFHLVQPQRAYFGQKDAQQVAVLRKMVRDLNFDLEIVVCPTVREPDGLALSSRNVYLSPAERQAATVLSRALFWARDQVQAGERRAAVLLEGMRRMIEAEPLCRIEYLEIVDAESLEPLDRLSGSVLIALAAYFGKTRLIDNVLLEGV
ncbi:pantoate--beta-alanine ligase [Meiothermus sp. QL-1]|uniref:pantoate--beta-alanine ligase n=1 Tax=Meiothermus sp. QL-1 TaxID=2058095 RepID=UPI000E0A93BC|nr:pantoate--beta-alanine ligase [Meiothermus sp. QL-1]RDI95949.1 pantoate--beta-alanine ligase [Meiothermus sp. QL-1]